MSKHHPKAALVTALFMLIVTLLSHSDACTSAIFSPAATPDGRMLLWKHRDSGFKDNFVAKVEATDSTMAFVALFNAGDSLLSEAWIGFNQAGFAVMNTASYNLAPDTARIKDREGLIMALALKTCRTVTDFTELLTDMAKEGLPLGIQANFGVTDATGAGAYIEADDHSFTIFDLADADSNWLVRTNYSYSGGSKNRLGEVRHSNALHLLSQPAAQSLVTPSLLIENTSRSFFHAGSGKDMLKSKHRYVADRGEMIIRRSSCASVVIQSAASTADPAGGTVMWVAIGFPALSTMLPVTLDSIPPELQPTAPGGHSPLCDKVNRLRDRAFPRKDRHGRWLFDMDFVRSHISAKDL